MAKINQEEYEILKGLDGRWKWIARDDENQMYSAEVYVFEKKPEREDGYWNNTSYDEYELLREGDSSFQSIKWEDEEGHNIAELIEEYEDEEYGYFNMKLSREFEKFIEESEETEVKKDIEWVKEQMNRPIYGGEQFDLGYEKAVEKFNGLVSQLDEPEQPKITLQDVTEKLWELPLNNRKLWLERLSDEFQEGYIVPLGLKTTDGEEQYLTYNGSYFASRRNKYLQQTFDTLEEIPEFYRELAERVL